MKKMNKMKIGYKVCLHYSNMQDNEYESTISEYFLYKLNEIVERKKECGPYGIFDTIDYAENYAEIMGKFLKKILKCEYIESNEHTFYIKTNTYIGTIPKGTVFADKFKLIEEVIK